MVIGSILHRQDFYKGTLFNGYFIGVVLFLIILLSLFTGMELSKSRPPQDIKTAEPV